MKFNFKIAVIAAIVILILGISGFIFFKYFFTYEQRNVFQRRFENITGQNLTVTVFGFNGNIIKRWTGVKKITAPRDGRGYVFFYTGDNKYIQIPDSVWYIAEEE